MHERDIIVRHCSGLLDIISSNCVLLPQSLAHEAILPSREDVRADVDFVVGMKDDWDHVLG